MKFSTFFRPNLWGFSDVPTCLYFGAGQHPTPAGLGLWLFGRLQRTLGLSSALREGMESWRLEEELEIHWKFMWKLWDYIFFRSFQHLVLGCLLRENNMIYKSLVLRHAATKFNSACLEYATYLPVDCHFKISTKKPMMNLWFTCQFHHKLSWCSNPTLPTTHLI